MMHAQVKPYDQVLLLQILSVKEVVEINRGVVYVLAIEPVSTLGLSILALRDMKVVLGPMCRIDQVATILHRQVCQTRIR